MDLKSGYPYWLVKNGLLNTYPSLHQDITCDVAVIGGGITGALMAYHLVEAGVDTVVLDKANMGFPTLILP
jgi:glycerol-3-phosphate dehydrogenase